MDYIVEETALVDERRAVTEDIDSLNRNEAFERLKQECEAKDVLFEVCEKIEGVFYSHKLNTIFVHSLAMYDDVRLALDFL